jgi:branched-chain amino acid transport system ATP-binding protein
VSLLEVRELHVRYGGVEAVRGVDLRVEEGEIVALLGANGAGKTTTLRAISALERVAEGEVLFDGRSLRGVRADRIARMGLRHVPEGRRIFARMTVRENLDVGAFGAKDSAKSLAAVLDTFPRLGERLEQPAGTLSGGEAQMLAVGRALIAAPRLLMLDEPSLGLAPLMVRSIFETLRAVRERGTTILLVEQNARQALALASRGYVMERGRIARQGPADELLDDPQLVAAYLGAS